MTRRVSVRAIMADSAGRICLIHRLKDGRDYWVTAGGGVEAGETYHEALRREMLEEVGSTIIDISDAPVFELQNDTQHQMFFTCREVARGVPTGDEYLRASETNVYDVQFVPVAELAALPIAPPEIKAQLIVAATVFTRTAGSG